MKFNSKKIALFFELFLFIVPIQAMDAPKKEFSQLSPAELKEYKDKLYVQFCAAQDIKKKYFELIKQERWNGKIRASPGDGLSTSESRCYNEYNEPATKTSIFLSGYCDRLILPCGHWNFRETLVYLGEVNISDFKQEFYQNIHSKFHKNVRVQRHLGKFAVYDLYKITKAIDGTPIPEVPDLNLSQDQALALWKEMKERYDKAERIP